MVSEHHPQVLSICFSSICIVQDDFKTVVVLQQLQGGPLFLKIWKSHRKNGEQGAAWWKFLSTGAAERVGHRVGDLMAPVQRATIHWESSSLDLFLLHL